MDKMASSRSFMRASTPSSGGRRAADHDGSVRAQHAARLVGELPPIAQSAEHLDQHHGSNIASANGSRRPSACTRRGARPHRAVKVAQHAEREIHPDIIIACRDERPADPAGTGAEIEHARVRHPGCLEHQLPDGLGDAIRQGALTLEARGERVIGGLSNLHDTLSFA